MKTEEDFAMKDTITKWELPEFLSKYEKEIEYKFDKVGLNNMDDIDFHFQYDSVNFCLYMEKIALIIFIMEFFIIDPEKNNGKREIWLDVIWVRIGSYRNKGIATYYIKKLIGYAIQEKVECIRINAMAGSYYFQDYSLENALLQKELEEFYRKFDSTKMSVILGE